VTCGRVIAEFCQAYTAAAETWDRPSCEALATGELFAWRIAASANKPLGPQGYIVQGILPFLLYITGREKSAVVKMKREVAGEITTNGLGLEVLPLLRYRAKVTIQMTTDGSTKDFASSDKREEPDSYDGWSCSRCRRGIGNMYLRCVECYAKNNAINHFICCDCFFAGRHLVVPETFCCYRKRNTRRVKKYELRYRWFSLNGLDEVIETCRTQLDRDKLPEFERTEETLRYLENHPAIKAIENEYLSKP